MGKKFPKCKVEAKSLSKYLVLGKVYVIENNSDAIYEALPGAVQLIYKLGKCIPDENIQKIYKLSIQLLDNLQKDGCKPAKVATVYGHLASELKIALKR